MNLSSAHTSVLARESKVTEGDEERIEAAENSIGTNLAKCKKTK